MPRATRPKVSNKNKKNKAKKSERTKPRKARKVTILDDPPKTYTTPLKPTPQPHPHKDFHLSGTVFLILAVLLLVLGTAYIVTDGKALSSIKSISLPKINFPSLNQERQSPQLMQTQQPQLKVNSKEVTVQAIPRDQPPKEGTEEYYRLKIQEANYCQTIQDCQKVEALCPFCNVYVNKQKAAQIRLLLIQAQDKFCPVQGWTCDSSSVKRQLLCLENKCITKAII